MVQRLWQRRWWIASLLFVGVTLLFGMVVNPNAGQAGEVEWQPIGPDGGTMFDIVAAPNTPEWLYTRSVAGISRSQDGGVTWELVAPYYNARGRTALVINPTNPNFIITTLENGNFLRSSNGGTTWSENGGGFDTTGLAIDAAGGSVWAAGDDNMYRSTDNGVNWEEIPFPLNNIALEVVAHPTISNKIYVKTVNGALFASSNGGTTWEGRASLGPYRIVAIDSSTNALYAIAGSSITGAGVRKSTDDGVTWTAFATGLPNQITSLVIDPANSNNLYAAAHNGDVYRTTGDGTVWEAVNAALPDGGNPNGGQLAIGGENGTTLYYADDGVYASQDAGSSWQWSGAGISALNMVGIAIGPGQVGRVYAAGWRSRFYSSNDGGMSWDFSQPINGVEPRIIVPAPSNPGILYMGTTNDGVYRSNNMGETWVAANAGMPQDYDYVPDITVSPTDPNHVVAALDIGRIFHSTDGGVTWTQAYDLDDSIRAVEFLPNNASIVWAVGDADLLRSTDGGATWETLSTIPSNSYTYSLEIHPTTPSIMYLSTSSRGTGVGALYRSTDSGATWSLLATGLPTDARIMDIWIDTTTPDTVWIAANRYGGTIAPRGYGVYRSTDGGDTWATANEGLRHLAVERLAGVGDTLYASTVYGGIWRLGNAPVIITQTPSATFTRTPTSTATAVPPTFTPTTTPTSTGTATPTATSVPATFTPTPTSTATATTTVIVPTFTPTATATGVASATATVTPTEPVATFTATATTTPTEKHLYLPLLRHD